MVDPQPLDLALADQPQQQAVRVGEDRRVLHAHRRQLGDVEEAAVVDLLGRHAPERQPVRLLVEQRVQPIEARALARAGR